MSICLKFKTFMFKLVTVFSIYVNNDNFFSKEYWEVSYNASSILPNFNTKYDLYREKREIPLRVTKEPVT